MNTFRSALALLAVLSIAPLAGGCAMNADSDGTDEASAESRDALICTTCEDDAPHEPPKHPDFVVLPGYTASIGSDGLWYVGITIKNQGTAAGFAGILAVNMGPDGQALWGTASVPTSTTLAAGQSKVITFVLGDHCEPGSPWGGAYNYSCIGSSLAPYYLKLRIDAWEQTYESNENNNSTIINL
ncbi:Hypothetical protein A7982_06417 [Minicystis rosea]|nr:Hypothetical protein A7982_06417 [Minicystis rosea]